MIIREAVWLQELQQHLRRHALSPAEIVRWAERFQPSGGVLNITHDERGFINFVRYGMRFGGSPFAVTYSGSISGIWRPTVVGESIYLAAGQSITATVNRDHNMNWIEGASGGYGGQNNGSTTAGAGGGGGAYQLTQQPFVMLRDRTYTLVAGVIPSGTSYITDGFTNMAYHTGGTEGGPNIVGVGGVATTGGGVNGSNGATGNGTGNGGGGGGAANDGGSGGFPGGDSACGAGEAAPDGYSGGSGRDASCQYGGGGGGQGARSANGGGAGSATYRLSVGGSFVYLYYAA